MIMTITQKFTIFISLFMIFFSLTHEEFLL